MKPLSFTYNGKNSWEDFKLMITFDVDLASSEPDVEAVSVPGRDGDVIVDNHRNKSVNQTFGLYCNVPHPKGTELMRQAIEWLRQDVQFHDFTLSTEPDYIRRGAVLTAVQTTVKEDGVYGSLTFNFKPKRYLKTGMTAQKLASGVVFDNTGSLNAEPKITITGTGDFTLSINGTPYGVKGMDTGTTIDSENQSVISANGTSNEFNKFQGGSFPILKPGKNTITWDDGFAVEIIPRIAVKL